MSCERGFARKTKIIYNILLVVWIGKVIVIITHTEITMTITIMITIILVVVWILVLAQ